MKIDNPSGRSLPWYQPEVIPQIDPEEPAVPEEDPDEKPDENPFGTPPIEVPPLIVGISLH